MHGGSVRSDGERAAGDSDRVAHFKFLPRIPAIAPAASTSTSALELSCSLVEVSCCAHSIRMGICGTYYLICFCMDWCVFGLYVCIMCVFLYVCVYVYVGVCICICISFYLYVIHFVYAFILL